mmetsp:Transcript_43591/g.79407  ORF Transcript_43591/g.79407 Transcript_43591/m.79407 type:complete len:838 (+) Transcript_43591:179-2692(+)
MCHARVLAWLLFCLVHRANALSPAETRRRRSQVNTLQREPGRPQPVGAVYAEHSGYPKGSNHSVEMLRFITAYGTGLEVVVDITPYVPLLQTAAAAHGELKFYSYIETWVSNDTGSSVLFVNTSSNNCSAATHFDGNGWELHADLIAWPKEVQQTDTKPFAAVTLATGRYGSAYRIGAVDWHKGNLTNDGSAVILDDKAALDVAAGASVYHCGGTAERDLRTASVFGYLAQQARFLQGDEREESLQMLAQSLVEMYAWQHLIKGKVESIGEDNLTARVSYNASLADIQVGSPVFFSSAEVLTAFKVTGGYALIPVPLEPMGNVTHVYPGMLEVELEYPCFGRIEGWPSLLLLKSSDALEKLRATVNDTIRFGEEQRPVEGVSLTAEVESYLSGPWFVRQNNGTLEWVPPLANLEVGSTPSTSVLELGSSPPSNDTVDRTVCVVSHTSSGNLFTRDFEFPTLAEGDRAVMQLTVTGHGWAATSEQCGEYCHAVYRFNINGVPAVNITQWRDDCKDNPIGPRQRGTWDESRNGWCPGSAEPGLYVDVTQWLSAGANVLRMDVVVWSNSTWSYTPYTNYGGFALDDRASLTVGLTMFAYDAEAVNAILQQPAALSAAEAAVRSGSSMPSALQIPAIPQRGVPPASFAEMRTSAFRKEQSSLLQRAGNLLPALDGVAGLMQTRPERPHMALAGSPQDQHRQLGAVSQHVMVQGESRFDFEARAPWYFYNSSSSGRPGEQALNVSRINLFNGDLVQGRSQLIRVSLPMAYLQKQLDWEQTAQVGLHLRLSKPPGNLSYDHWDRQGSIGILVDAKPVAASSGLSLYRAPLQSRSKLWNLVRSS